MEEVLLRVTKHKHYKRVCNQPIEADISNKSPGQIRDFSSSLCNEIIYGQRRHNTGVIFISCTKPYIGSSQCDRDFFISLSPLHQGHALLATDEMQWEYCYLFTQT